MLHVKKKRARDLTKAYDWRDTGELSITYTLRNGKAGDGDSGQYIVP